MNHKSKIIFLEDAALEINKSQVARELNVDRRTVGKYLNGFKKSKKRKCNNCISPFYQIIKELLDPNSPQVFYYKSLLWQYLVDHYDYSGSYVNFCNYLKRYEEFADYFRKRRP